MYAKGCFKKTLKCHDETIVAILESIIIPLAIFSRFHEVKANVAGVNLLLICLERLKFFTINSQLILSFQAL
jgi:hypothetical protein